MTDEPRRYGMRLHRLSAAPLTREMDSAHPVERLQEVVDLDEQGMSVLDAMDAHHIDYADLREVLRLARLGAATEGLTSVE